MIFCFRVQAGMNESFQLVRGKIGSQIGSRGNLAAEALGVSYPVSLMAPFFFSF